MTLLELLNIVILKFKVDWTGTGHDISMATGETKHLLSFRNHGRITVELRKYSTETVTKLVYLLLQTIQTNSVTLGVPIYRGVNSAVSINYLFTKVNVFFGNIRRSIKLIINIPSNWSKQEPPL